MAHRLHCCWLFVKLSFLLALLAVGSLVSPDHCIAVLGRWAYAYSLGDHHDA